ncbi:unnamed protein product [Didymodactylos carnosus]|uniref:Uncharacterized protein n=1 Tax=Didymodactylos carnosus TaxID=1234261 RepID=A0A815A5V8_9BILA|nr:unnamed protein product [Didymodactylos carnosus]CAF1396339.1 unnamed protein product [Didymodactylos carnosus]CAF4020529.1 unnamed protein product [Didymodactylos carnosus]CAF4203820.1 unnamed protein product [Didymodactylos carnosus]
MSIYGRESTYGPTEIKMTYDEIYEECVLKSSWPNVQELVLNGYLELSDQYIHQHLGNISKIKVTACDLDDIYVSSTLKLPKINEVYIQCWGWKSTGSFMSPVYQLLYSTSNLRILQVPPPLLYNWLDYLNKNNIVCPFKTTLCQLTITRYLKPLNIEDIVLYFPNLELLKVLFYEPLYRDDVELAADVTRNLKYILGKLLPYFSTNRLSCLSLGLHLHAGNCDSSQILPFVENLLENENGFTNSMLHIQANFDCLVLTRNHD